MSVVEISNNLKNQFVQVGKVFETKQYSLFGFNKSNRFVKMDSTYLEDLKRSISEYGQLVPVIVNGEFEVFDGQHRLKVCEILGEPVRFVIDDRELDVKKILEVQKVRKDWEIGDFVDCEIRRGNKEYKKIKELHLTYKLPYYVLCAVCNDTLTYKKKRIIDGKAKIKNLEKTIEVCKKLVQVQQATDHNIADRMYRCFILFFNNPKYDHDHMIRKLQKYYYLLRKEKKFTLSIGIESFMQFFEEVYNYKEPLLKKVSLALNGIDIAKLILEEKMERN